MWSLRALIHLNSKQISLVEQTPLSSAHDSLTCRLNANERKTRRLCTLGGGGEEEETFISPEKEMTHVTLSLAHILRTKI